MERDSALYSQSGINGRRVTLRDVKEAAHWSKLLVIGANMMMACVVVSFYVFTPIIIMSFGFEGLQANLVRCALFLSCAGWLISLYAQQLSVTPFLAAFVGIVIFSRSSDYFKERSLHVSVLSLDPP